MRPLDPFAVPLGGLELVEASAGTGKTHAITTLFLRALLARCLHVSEILVVTFTKAATAELRDRLRKRLREAVGVFERGTAEGELGRLLAESRDPRADRARLVDALASFDRASVYTIHGFCQRVLESHAFEGRQRFDATLTSDARAITRELVEDFWTSELEQMNEAELWHLRARKVSLARWHELATRVSASPELGATPSPARLDHRAALGRYLECRARLARDFAQARPALARLLGDAGTLKQSSYKADQIPDWLDRIARALGETAPALVGYDPLIEKLHPSALADATKKGKSVPSHPFFEASRDLSRAHAEASAAFDDWLLSLEHRLVERARRELAKKKLLLGVQSYDDLLLELARALDGPGGDELAQRLAERHPVALVDEFQDTDPIQYRIFSRIYAGRGALFLIGDPKQAIYAFRGADIFSYLDAAADAGEARFTLSENRRSDRGLVRAINTLFSRAERPFVLEGIEFSPVASHEGAADHLTRAGAVAPGLEIAFVAHEPGAGQRGQITKEWKGFAERVAAHVARTLASGLLLDGRPIEPGHLAILTRKNDQAFAIQAELRKLGVPSVMLGDKSVLDVEQAHEMALILRALARPSDERAVLTALSTSPFGVTAEALYALRDDERAWESRIEAFQRWRSLWERHGFMRAFRSLLRDAGAYARLLVQPGGERKLVNFLHLAELLHRAAVDEHLGIFGLGRWFDDARFDPVKRSELAPEAQQLRLESDARAVKLTTVHKSKGLEYELVFCPYLWDGTDIRRGEELLCFHDPADGHRPKIALRELEAGSPERTTVEAERRAENMRLAYVALTRARRRTTVFWGPFVTAERSPLAELLHAPEPGAQPGESAAARVHRSDADELRADLMRVVEAGAGSIELTDVTTEPGPLWRAAPVDPGSFSARAITRTIRSAWRSSSFSALVAGAEPVSLTAALGRDVDEGTGRVESGPPHGAARARVPLADFPRGARSGDALHEILQHADFGRGDREELPRLARRALERHGIATSFAPAVVAALDDVLATPLLSSGSSFSLADIGRARRLSELEFTFPVAARDGIDSIALGRVFERFPQGLPEGTAARVAELGFAALRGYLRGFIDLVIEHEGRFYVLDYKSNHLGDHAEDYAPAALARAMSHHRYFLQYHLYSVAVRRYLARRMHGFDPDRQFGGVLYLFLRGMSPERGPATGVYFERPPRERLDALDALLGGGP